MCGGRGVAGGGCFRRVAWAILETGSCGWGSAEECRSGVSFDQRYHCGCFLESGDGLSQNYKKKSFFLTWVDVWDQLVSMLFASLAMRVLVLIPISCVWVIPEDVLSKITLVKLLIKRNKASLELLPEFQVKFGYLTKPISWHKWRVSKKSKQILVKSAINLLRFLSD